MASGRNNIYLRSYGNGTLTTMSMRGGASSHTTVLWNNIPIQSPTLGLIDLSLLNGVNANVTVSESGNSTMWGSGAMAGVIAIDDRLSNESYVSVKVSLGSFGLKKLNLATAYVKDKLSIEAKYISEEADNNFEIKIPSLSLNTKQVNSHYKLSSLQSQVVYSINTSQNLSLSYWGQKTNRQIPPTIFQNLSNAFQDDLSNRWLLSYKLWLSKVYLQLKTAYFDEDNNYTDPQISSSSFNNFKSSIIDFSLDYEISNNHKLLLGSSYVNTDAITNGFKDGREEERLAAFVSYNFQFNRFDIQASSRIESANELVSPLIPSLGMEYLTKNNFKIGIRASKNYRFPTLNDLYWNPGGNDKLESEIGVNYETNLEKDFNIGSSNISINTSLYTRKVKNWIQWGRLNNDKYFSAYNLAEVWSRGGSFQTKYSFNISKARFEIIANYKLTLSTHLKASKLPKFEVGDQLWYVPRNSASLNFKALFNNFSFSNAVIYNDKTNGLNENVASFYIWNILFEKDFSLKASRFQSYIKFNNILNKNYFIIERRPMPGFNFEIGINYFVNFKKKINK